MKKVEQIPQNLITNYLGLTQKETDELSELFIEYLSDVDKSEILFSKLSEFGLTEKDILYIAMLLNVEINMKKNNHQQLFDPNAVLSYDPSLN